VGNPKTVLKGGYLGWLCKLFDKALVEALACGALAMCFKYCGFKGLIFGKRALSSVPFSLAYSRFKEVNI
jgi:hypothetical protein